MARKAQNHARVWLFVATSFMLTLHICLQPNDIQICQNALRRKTTSEVKFHYTIPLYYMDYVISHMYFKFSFFYTEK